MINWILTLYTVGLIIGVVFLWPVILVWALISPKIRAGCAEKCGYYPDNLRNSIRKNRGDGFKTVWIHAVSVGEFNAVRPLIQQCLTGNYNVVVSVTTQTAYELAIKHYRGRVIFCPFDFPWAINAAIRLIKPDCFLIAETELWPNLITLVSQYCPVMLINGRLSDNSYQGYQRWLKWLVKPMLSKLSLVLAQTPDDAQRYQMLGAEQAECIGNMKLDINKTVNEEVLAALQQSLALSSNAEEKVLLLASTQPGEEHLFMDELVSWLKLGHRVIVAPRHPERADDVVALFEQSVKQTQLGISICKRSVASASNVTNTKVVILDTIGELSTLYRLVDVAIIGGSFLPKRGGQNPLEALAAGVPVITGPYMKNFRGIMALIIHYNAGLQASSPQEAVGHAKRLVRDRDNTRRQAMIEAGYRLLNDNKGATDKTFNKVKVLLGD
jgi:3-deoxy-D-manno-octulosonic-acid transferase